ncbi:MAG: Ldh family oxidoreductase, partial [Deltaproteobacteria bacterium]|nr:Ldh family oxidoreductase [Deltaproteobacteria bacterium]
MMKKETKLTQMNPNFLEFLYKKFWMKLGASEAHADCIARVIALADRQGKLYQGMGVLEALLIPIEGKIGDLTAEPELVNEGPAFSVYNGHRSTGYYTITKMTEKAVEKAEKYGIAISFGYNHIDAGSFFGYTSIALEHDMVAMASNNSLPLHAPYGGMDFKMSVPPFDAACPAGEELPMVVSTKLCEGYDADITDALMGSGKLKDKLLVDPETGELTDDVRPYGSLIEGYGRVADCSAPWYFKNPRTYSLNIWNEFMTAIINPGGTPSSDLPAIPSDYFKPDSPSPVGGSYVIVIDPSKFGPMANVKEKADRYIRSIKDCRKRPGVEEIYMPDEWGIKKVYRNKEAKVDIMVDHLNAFKGFMEKYGMRYEALEKEWA